jgi:formylmethanofuran dehydrogenase subunit B
MPLFEPATCPFCSLHCDDLRLETEAGRLVRCEPACARASAGYERTQGVSSPLTASDGSPDLPSALRTAAAWLDAACQPLIVLAGDVDLETARAAVALARSRSALLAVDDRNAGSWLSLAMKSAGLLSATLGELRAHAGQLILCGFDPQQDQPRFWDFLTPDQKATAILIDTPDPLDAVRRLRLALRPEGPATGDPWSGVARKIAAATSGAVLFGVAWLQSGIPLVTELLLWLVELNAAACWYGFPVVPEPNCVGLSETLLTETGYPGNVRFSHGQVEYAPFELQIEPLVVREQIDAVVLVGSPRFPQPAAMAQVKSIQVNPEPPEGQRDLWFPCARPGVDAAGGMLRLDGVPVRLQPVTTSERPAASEILAGLAKGVRR